MPPQFDLFTNHFRNALIHLIQFAHDDVRFPPNNIQQANFHQGHGTAVRFGLNMTSHFLVTGPRMIDYYSQILHVVVSKLLGTFQYLKLYRLALISVGLQPVGPPGLRDIIEQLRATANIWRVCCSEPALMTVYNNNNQPEEAFAFPSSNPIVLRESINPQGIVWNGENEVLLAFLLVHEFFRDRVGNVIHDYYLELFAWNDMD